MILRKPFNAIPARLLSLLLTVICHFTVSSSWAVYPKGVDRRATFLQAFEAFHNVLYFLSGSDSFLSQLTAEELRQFELLGNSIVPREILISIGTYVPFEGKTSDRVKTRVIFSDNEKDFIIPPDKTVRTAKMHGNVWFNTNIINNPNNQFNVLDVIQILFHEFGHTIPSLENTTTIDHLAAKAKNYLAPFYKENVVNSDLTIRFFLLPFLKSRDLILDFQPRPIILFSFLGVDVSAKFDFKTIGPSVRGYLPVVSALQAYTRVVLVPEVETYVQGLGLKWQVQETNFVRAADGFNYVSLNSNPQKTGHQEPLPPQSVERQIHQYILTEELGATLGSPNPHLSPVPLHDGGELLIGFKPELLQAWAEPLKLMKTENGRHLIEGVIQRSEKVSDVLLLGTLGNTAFQFPGEIEILTEKYYKIRFSIPEKGGPSGKSLIFRGIALNSEKRWDFEELLTVPTKKSSLIAAPKVEKISVWNGESWVSVKEMLAETLEVDQIRMRYEFSMAPNNLNHLDITWVTTRDIEKAGVHQGAEVGTQIEVIPGAKLIQKRQGKSLTVEFTSRLKVADPVHYSEGNSADGRGYSLLSTYRFGMRSIQMVDTELHKTSFNIRPIESRWKYIFLPRSTNASDHGLCRDFL